MQATFLAILGISILVIVTPHNEAIRYEFERGFSAWHQQKYGSPVKIDWRSIGGTTEIMRYLKSEFAADMKRWWTSEKAGALEPSSGQSFIFINPLRVGS